MSIRIRSRRTCIGRRGHHGRATQKRHGKKNREAVVILAKQDNDKITATLCATLSTMRQENNARFARVEAKLDENANALDAMQTRIDALQHSKKSSSSGSRKGNESNSARAVATGFTEPSTEEEEVVREILQGGIKNMRWMKALKIHIVQQNRSHMPSCNSIQKRIETDFSDRPTDNNAPPSREPSGSNQI